MTKYREIDLLFGGLKCVVGALLKLPKSTFDVFVSSLLLVVPYSPRYESVMFQKDILF